MYEITLVNLKDLRCLTEANFVLDTFSPNVMFKGGYELISCLDRFGVSFLAELADMEELSCVLLAEW